MTNQLITNRLPIDYSLISLMSLMSSISYAWNNQGWLQVDLGRAIKVCGVATQGCWALHSYAVVTDFKLSYSFHRNVWTTYLDTKSTAKVSLESL